MHRLRGGSDELEPLDVTLDGFIASARSDPGGFLGLQPLVQLHREGKSLQPGESISVYPPFVFEESAGGVSVEVMPSLELIRAYADLARDIARFPVGTRFKIQLPNDRNC